VTLEWTAYLLSRSLVRRLERLQPAAAAIAASDLTQRVQVDSGDEVGQLGRQFNALAAHLRAANSASSSWWLTVQGNRSGCGCAYAFYPHLRFDPPATIGSIRASPFPGATSVEATRCMNPGLSRLESESAGRWNAFSDSAAHLLAPILNILVPHSGHVPSVAGRPFFIVTGLAPLIWRCVLHFMQ
jgi:HAMP domain-containing protein